MMKMIKQLLLNMKIKKALKIALKEYDKATVLDIIQNEKDGWSNETEILNNIDVELVKPILEAI